MRQRKARACFFRPFGLISFRMVWACFTGISSPCPSTPFPGALCDCFTALLAIPDARGNQDGSVGRLREPADQAIFPHRNQLDVLRLKRGPATSSGPLKARACRSFAFGAHALQAPRSQLGLGPAGGGRILSQDSGYAEARSFWLDSGCGEHVRRFGSFVLKSRTWF